MSMIRFAIHKSLQSAQGRILLDVSCELEQGRLVTLYGPSGAGKTTILRMLAGLASPEGGIIRAGDETWFDGARGIDLPPQKRKTGFVFQDYALFPNMTVRDNLRYALKKGQDKAILDELIGVMELEQLHDRRPGTLSGGQKQRVALARALVSRPVLLLLDEPLSALDSQMRMKLQDHILKAHSRYGLTSILVSHDMSEVFKMSDQVFVLEEGKISRQGSPREVFFNQQLPGDQFRFSGRIEGIRAENGAYIVSVLVGDNQVKLPAREEDIWELAPGDQVLVSSRALDPVIRKITASP